MSQTERIKRHLNKKGTITPIQALNLYGCFRLAARISELRNEGLPIQTNLISKNGRSYAKYKLEKNLAV